jgi:hypothetical protein
MNSSNIRNRVRETRMKKIIYAPLRMDSLRIPIRHCHHRERALALEGAAHAEVTPVV